MALDADDDSLLDSLIVPFFIGNRTIRIHVGGRRDALRRFAVKAATLQHGAADEASVVESVSALASELGLTIGDVLPAGSSPSGRFNVAELIFLAAQRPTAAQAWPRIKAVLTSASDEELDALMAPDELARVRPLLRSVLDDLDEGAADAEEELRRELAPEYCYLLLA